MRPQIETGDESGLSFVASRRLRGYSVAKIEAISGYSCCDASID